MIRTVIIMILALLGIFIHPFDPGFVDFIYRFILFAALSYTAYISLQSTENTEQPVAEKPYPARPRTDLPFEYQDDWKISELLENDEKTDQFLKDQFNLLANLVYSDNGWIFILDGEKLRVHYHENFKNHEQQSGITETSIGGLLKLLDDNDKVLIENNLKNSEHLLSYYQDTEYQPGSFLGIPIIISDREKVFFTFDASNAEHFNQEDTNLYGKIAKNTQIWIGNRVTAYNLQSRLKENSNQVEFARDLIGNKTINTAIDNLAIWISREFEATRLTISVVKKENGKGLIKKVIGQRDNYEENAEFDLDEGLTGWVIGKNKPYLIEDLEKGEYFIPRYSKEEKSNFGLRSFLGIPISVGDKVFGAVTLEHKIAGKYRDKEKIRLIRFVDVFSNIFRRNPL